MLPKRRALVVAVLIVLAAGAWLYAWSAIRRHPKIERVVLLGFDGAAPEPDRDPCWPRAGCPPCSA